MSQDCFQLFGRAIVKPPLALFQKEREMGFGNAIIFSQMSFRLIPEILDAVNVVVFVNKGRAVINAIMLELRDIERIVGSKIVCVDNAIWHHVVPNDGE